MTREEARLKAFGLVLKEQVAKVQPGAQHVELFCPNLNIDTAPIAAVMGRLQEAITARPGPSPVTVQVDMRPVAAAIVRQTEVMVEQSKLIAKLIQTLTDHPIEVNVEAAEIAPGRPARKIRITTADDGSQVVEEVSEDA